MKFIIICVAAAAIFIILDLIWFSVAGNFFKQEIGNIARLTSDGAWNVRYLPALIVYLLMGAGLMLLVFPQASDVKSAILLGAVFGLVGYGLYDLTNLATLTDWTTRFSLVDMAWGTFLCATTSGIVYHFLYSASFLNA